MSQLRRRVFHDCPLPTVPDPTSTYRWTCDCGARWERSSDLIYGEGKQGPPWHRRTVQHVLSGFWWCLSRPDTWEPQP